MGRRQNQRNQRPIFEQSIYSVNTHDTLHGNQCNSEHDELLADRCFLKMQKKIEEQDSLITELKSKIESLENKSGEKSKNWWKEKSAIRLSIMIGGLILIFLLFWMLTKPGTYRELILNNDADSIIFMKNTDFNSLAYDKIEVEIKKDIEKYDSLKKRISEGRDDGSIKKLNEAFIEKLKKRNDDFLKEKEKEKDSLVRDVVIINLVGRYFLIFCCMVGFVVLVWAYTKYRSKDDIFD